MALNIRNIETDRLATELARFTGVTKTSAVTTALRERLERVRNQEKNARFADELTSIANQCAELPVYDTRDAETILGYDKNGLPT